ncbi:hypothetical protein L6654_27080 [Bradyrhizobium sp. WYCCWR 13023]|uniref:Uncharacterized protein n=1 Tax=Bradyrhizobium zhengyangense TaxID=2911009 RepID=A0A9X1UCF0_9BRAD|nr:hypothetical protein [Bradyrhizobium zhengyangense]MCG2630299.1 hypothetical protein [Bradyrhizobium zhengyangense]
MEMRVQQVMRLLAAAVFASFAATLAVIPHFLQVEDAITIVLVTQGLNAAMMMFTAAIAHALLFGLPLFLLVRRKRSRVGIVACALGGFLVGATPFGILALLSMISGGKPTFSNDLPTEFGWTDYVRSVGLAGLSGLVGGVAFWATTRPSESNAKSWSIVSAAAALTCGIFILPIVVRDRSCHVIFTSARTEIFANLKVPADAWQKLEQKFADFGQAHELSLLRDEHTQEGRLMWRSLNLCNDAGVNIDVYDAPWLAYSRSPLADEGMTLSIYSQKPDADWRPLARQLLSEIGTT